MASNTVLFRDAPDKFLGSLGNKSTSAAGHCPRGGREMVPRKLFSREQTNDATSPEIHSHLCKDRKIFSSSLPGSLAGLIVNLM